MERTNVTPIGTTGPATPPAPKPEEKKPETTQASATPAKPNGATTPGTTSSSASTKADASPKKTGSKPTRSKGKAKTKGKPKTKASPGGKPPGGGSKKASKSPDRPSTDGKKTFAFRLTEAESDRIHKAAGPRRASDFARAILVAAATEDPSKLTAALREQLKERDKRLESSKKKS